VGLPFLRKQGLSNKLVNKLFKPVKRYVYSKSKRRIGFSSFNLSIKEVSSRFKNLNEIYKYFHQYYWHASPDWLTDHRNYFSEESRGFGEDAFHAAWYLFLKEFQPKNLLEIGIYRGQVISLWNLIGEKENLDMSISGISPFSDAGDEYTTYMGQIDYYEDVLLNFREFNLPVPNLHRSLKENGIIVMDDSALFSNYTPPIYSFAGHPGPSRVADQIESFGYKEILSVGHNRFFQKGNLK